MSEMIPAIPLAQQVTQNSIQSGPLPADQNITFLKQEGIRYLKAMAGQTWSNYNDSDPGVTILEQLCYALTELGYVNSFPLKMCSPAPINVLLGAAILCCRRDFDHWPHNC